MAFQQDWIIRQIEIIVQFAARVLFNKDKIEYEVLDEAHMTDTDLLHLKLLALLRAGKLCQAEDLLFEHLEAGNDGHAKLALDFYTRLNALSDEALEAGGLPREEVEEGLRDAMDTLGVEVLA